MNPVGKGSVGSTVTVRVPKTHPLPEMLGTMAGRPPTDVVPVTATANSLSIKDVATKREPGSARPRAARQASRAEVPVPHGDRSTRPLRTVAPRSRPAPGSSSPVTIT